MSQTQSVSQQVNPIEQYKKIVNERLRKTENLKGIAQAIVEDLINFLETVNVATWGLSIVALNENFATVSFRAESRDPSIKVEVFHLDEAISGKVTENVEVRMWSTKENANEITVVIEFKRTE